MARAPPLGLNEKGKSNDFRDSFIYNIRNEVFPVSHWKNSSMTPFSDGYSLFPEQLDE